MRRRKHTLSDWIGEAFAEDKDGPCTAIALVHIVGTEPEEIYTVKLDGSSKFTPDSLANMLFHKAESYAEELVGVQTFNLLAFYKQSNEPKAKKPFTVSGLLDMQSSLTTEGPHPQGFVQQAMRHSEAVMQLAFRQTSMLFESTQQTLQQLAAQNAKLMGENRDAMEIVQKIMLDQASGAHQYRMEELKFARSTDERKALMKAAPALINSITGREIVPQSSEDTALVESIIDNLDENKLRALINTKVLPDHIMSMFAARAARSYEAKQRQIEDGSERIESGIDPELDTVGDS